VSIVPPPDDRGGGGGGGGREGVHAERKKKKTRCHFPHHVFCRDGGRYGATIVVIILLYACE